MALLITRLAFDDPMLATSARAAVLGASLLAVGAGAFLLRVSGRRRDPDGADTQGAAARNAPAACGTQAAAAHL